ncbi:hypothetical protein AB0L13_34205 [Saccharopolyspora shandongensis]|uniref:hypothetical protein n=1 Tax=Saccharopolyspora shandongensis TaxID=418495 RepID=UPI003437451B
MDAPLPAADENLSSCGESERETRRVQLAARVEALAFVLDRLASVEHGGSVES